MWNNDNIYYRRRIDSVFTNWRRLAFADEIPTSLPANGGNADTLGGIPRNYGQAPFGTIPSIGNDGVMEIGRYIDFHSDNSGSYDYSTRI
jgi:hypothetical protein